MNMVSEHLSEEDFEKLDQAFWDWYCRKLEKRTIHPREMLAYGFEQGFEAGQTARAEASCEQ